MEYFSVGRVFSRAFKLVGDTMTSVGLFALLFVLFETGVSLVVQNIMIADLGELVGNAARRGLSDGLSGLAVLASLFGLLIMSASWAGVVGGMLKQERSGQVTFGDCVQLALSGFLPSLGIIVLYWLGVMLGWLFIVVPGVILICMWSVALPAKLAEGIGVFDAFSRSRELTRGNRLSIFWILLLLVIAYYIVSAMLTAGLFGSAGLGALQRLETGEGLQRFGTIAAVVSIPIGLVSGLVLRAVVASLYIETVLVKDGGRRGDVAGVFD